LNFLERFSNNPQTSNFTNIRAGGAELFHSDGRTDMTKLIDVFRNFSKAPRNWLFGSGEILYATCEGYVTLYSWDFRMAFQSWLGNAPEGGAHGPNGGLRK